MNGAQIILEKDDLSTEVVLNHQNEQDVGSGLSESEKVNRTLTHMIFYENPPGLRRHCVRRMPWNQIPDRISIILKTL